MEGFKLVGKKLMKQTCNKNGQAAIDCGSLWKAFMEEEIMKKNQIKSPMKLLLFTTIM